MTDRQMNGLCGTVGIANQCRSGPVFLAFCFIVHSLAVKVVGVSIGECGHFDDVDNVKLVVPEHALPSPSGIQ